MLVGVEEILSEGRKRKIAIGSFNTPNLECLLAVLDAAETLDVPVIVAHAQCHEIVSPLDKIGRVMIALAKESKVQVCVHLDHGEDFDYCKRAIELGFTSVMIDYSAKSYRENIEGTCQVVHYAHGRGVGVEAELGRLPQREGGGSGENSEELYTNPELVEEYLEKTGVDALAIAFGTAHGIYKIKPKLNLEVITEVRKRTNIPLVMHGGSGISAEEYRKVIHRGIDKINYYTYMAYAGYAAAKVIAERKVEGFYHDMALSAQNAMQENALSTLKVFSGRE